jgi:hypothetical protein
LPHCRLLGTNPSPDFGQLGPTLAAARHDLLASHIEGAPDVMLAAAGYGHQVHTQALVDQGITFPFPHDASKRVGGRHGWNGGLTR